MRQIIAADSNSFHCLLINNQVEGIMEIFSCVRVTKTAAASGPKRIRSWMSTFESVCSFQIFAVVPIVVMLQFRETTAFVPLSSYVLNHNSHSNPPSLLLRRRYRTTITSPSSNAAFIGENYNNCFNSASIEDDNEDYDESQEETDDDGDNDYDESLISHPDHRYTADDWFHNVITWPKSTILHACRGPILAVMLWSFLLCALQQWHKVIACFCVTIANHHSVMVNNKIWGVFFIKTMPKTIIPHAATITALSLLLVFRTNSAYSKWVEGRRVWEELLTISRQFTRILYLYPEFDDKRDTMFRLIAAFPYLLHRHVQPAAEYATAFGTANTPSEDVPWEYRVAIVPQTEAGPMMHRPISKDTSNKYQLQTTASKIRTPIIQLFQRLLQRRSSSSSSPHTATLVDEKHKAIEYWIDRRSMPWCLFPANDMSLQLCANSANRPIWVANRLGQIIATTPFTDNYSTMERERILQYVERLTSVVSQSERIHRTAVPLRYARHCLRALTFWLWTLPLALLRDFGWITVPAMGGLAFVMYGIYQIGYMIEDPFQGSLRLTHLSDQILRDVAMFQRNATAITERATIPKDRRSKAFKITLQNSNEWINLPVKA